MYFLNSKANTYIDKIKSQITFYTVCIARLRIPRNLTMRLKPVLSRIGVFEFSRHPSQLELINNKTSQNNQLFSLLLFFLFKSNVSQKKSFVNLLTLMIYSHLFLYFPWKPETEKIMSELASIPEQIIPEAKPRTTCPVCSFDAGNIKKLKTHILLKHPKGQLNSEWLYEVTVSPKTQT